MGAKESIRHWVFSRAVVLAVSALVLLHIDPLGIEEATAQRAERTIMRIAAPLYHGSNKVTVVLIDQEFIERYAGAWPIAYHTQGVLLRRIAQHAPTAVFLDLLYKNQHVADNPTDLLGAVAGFRVPIYVAGIPEEGSLVDWKCRESRTVNTDQDSILRQIRTDRLIKDPSGRSADHIAMVSWSGCEDQYPLMLGYDANAPTPAYALYLEYCEWAAKAADPAIRRPDQGCRFPLGTHPRPMAVRWGAYPPASQAQFYERNVCQRKSDSVGFTPRFITFVEQFFLSFVGNIHPSDDPDEALPCPSVNVIPASLLMSPQVTAPLDDLFKDHLILVGADVPGIPDVVSSPVHGQIPGVMLHAMALDNLIQLQHHYLRKMPEAAAVLLSFLLLLPAAYAGTHEFPRLAHFMRPQGGYSRCCQMLWVIAATFALVRDDWPKCLALLAGALLSIWLAPKESVRILTIFITVCSISILMVVCGWTPTNWIELAIAAAATHEAAKHEVLHDELTRVRKWWDARSVVALTVTRTTVRQLLHRSTGREL